ncbi:MAG TPA: DUF5320 domain-containing protein [Spirochaetota bacterium]|jgi:hypothetical protein|nr:MAG: hypothetical protein BWX91_00348 [Spirochaetes bacterium ADurb.Bin133]HNZ27463.1 DUF5320 domain-containing protein [Spirochaetota bacterium]HPY86385.1 DUF5320 domain-containing protein [Spirochaetota bacterium]HQB61845.1 DUF5320 domain-containing protein [Spirochaetota bacterium]
MSGRDGTGPMGLGSMTGGARGFCSGFATSGYANFGVGRGFFGGGRGRRNIYNATGLPRWARYNQASGMNRELSKEDELEVLKNQARYMNQSIENINKRIKELENQE